MKGKITWQGVAFIKFKTDDDKVVLFDPWTKTEGSPTCPYETEYFKQIDLILVSHDHFDHIGSAAAICKQSGALLGGPDETNEKTYKRRGAKTGPNR